MTTIYNIDQFTWIRDTGGDIVPADHKFRVAHNPARLERVLQ